MAEQMFFHDLAVDLELSFDSITVSEDQAIVLYRAARKLLINVSKHARVDRAFYRFYSFCLLRLRARFFSTNLAWRCGVKPSVETV